MLTTILLSQLLNEQRKKSEGWRSDEAPTMKFSKHPLTYLEELPELSDKEKKDRLADFYAAQNAMELSVGEAAMAFVYQHGNKDSGKPGPILKFASTLSSRYLDLYQAYVAMEAEKGMPLIPINAGQMKNHGFTSREIIKMKKDCQKFTEINHKLIAHFKGESSQEKYHKALETLMDAKKRNAYLQQKPETQNSDLVTLFQEYDKLPEKASLDKSFFLMHEFAHMSHEAIADQLYFVGAMDLSRTEVSEEERLRMEIRHRVTGSGSAQTSPGAIGTNPLAYLNLLKKGEPEHREAEFRGKMYFAYMSNHFANAIMQDPEAVNYINSWLSEHNKGWALDREYIAALNERGKQYLPPIFRYGANAALNAELREAASAEQRKKFAKDNPNITLQQAMTGSAPKDSTFNYKLSNREIFGLTGDLSYSPEKHEKNYDKRLPFVTGASVFNLRDPEHPKLTSPSAKTYAEGVKEYGIPVIAGISGTLDQSTAMAGLVGIGSPKLLESPEKMKIELERIRLAYLAFMLPTRDHSVHEIMQSATTYGLDDYVAGPGYQNTIFTQEKDRFLALLKQAQKSRGFALADEYLRKEPPTLPPLPTRVKPIEKDVIGDISRIKPPKVPITHQAKSSRGTSPKTTKTSPAKKGDSSQVKNTKGELDNTNKTKKPNRKITGKKGKLK